MYVFRGHLPRFIGDVMHPLHCKFEYTDEPGVLLCSQCGRTWNSESPPERSHRRCPKAPSRGLGDTVAKIAKAIGFKKQCGGCGKRQDKLNELLPYRDVK